MRTYFDMTGYGEGSVEPIHRYFWEKYSLNIIGGGYFHSSGVRVHVVEFAPFDWIILDNAVCIADWYLKELGGNLGD